MRRSPSSKPVINLSDRSTTFLVWITLLHIYCYYGLLWKYLQFLVWSLRDNRKQLRNDFTVTNIGSQGYPLYIYGRSRNVSNQDNTSGYFRPLSISNSGNFADRGVTRLRCDGYSPQPGDYVRLTTSDGTNKAPVTIPNGQTYTYRIGAAVGGSASTPFNIGFRGIAYTLTQPPE